jgi:predicted XRE-type DNA-binding protein
MQIRELSKPVTAKRLNESLAKKFGYKLNLEQFNDVQLEDARNKLRTKLSQFEVSESFESMQSSTTYQKTRAMLDCINQELLEREMNEGAKPDYIDLDKDGDKAESMKKAAKDKKKEKAVEENYVNKTFRTRASQLSVPASWINAALERVELGESDRAELKAELTTRYDLSESQASYVLLEGEEEKAENIMASKDMVEQITGWLEDTAALKAEQLLELVDSIRETQGSDVAQQYNDAVKQALESLYSALEASRQGLSKGLAIISGGEVDTMGSAPAGEMPDAGGMAAPEMGAGEEAGAEMGGAPEGTVGREKRESVDYSRRLGMILANNQSKKK